jgi:hypothetical protein
MQTRDASEPTLRVDGVVRRVDPVGRALEVLAAGTPVTFDVRPDCAVTLRGERVKLRLVLPRDRVRVAYTETPGALAAVAVEVQPGCPGRTERG